MDLGNLGVIKETNFMNASDVNLIVVYSCFKFKKSFFLKNQYLNVIFMLRSSNAQWFPSKSDKEIINSPLL